MKAENKSNAPNNRLVLEQTIRTLAALNSLMATAADCKNEAGFIFHILNHTISYIHYDRAILLSGNGRRILGISGTSRPSRHSELAHCIKRLKKSLSKPDELQIISDDSFSAVPKFWQGHQEKSEGTSLVWIPFTSSSEELKKNIPIMPYLFLSAGIKNNGDRATSSFLPHYKRISAAYGDCKVRAVIRGCRKRAESSCLYSSCLLQLYFSNHIKWRSVSLPHVKLFLRILPP